MMTNNNDDFGLDKFCMIPDNDLMFDADYGSTDDPQSNNHGMVEQEYNHEYGSLQPTSYIKQEVVAEDPSTGQITYWRVQTDAHIKREHEEGAAYIKEELLEEDPENEVTLWSVPTTGSLEIAAQYNIAPQPLLGTPANQYHDQQSAVAAGNHYLDQQSAAAAANHYRDQQSAAANHYYGQQSVAAAAANHYHDQQSVAAANHDHHQQSVVPEAAAASHYHHQQQSVAAEASLANHYYHQQYVVAEASATNHNSHQQALVEKKSAAKRYHLRKAPAKPKRRASSCRPKLTEEYKRTPQYREKRNKNNEASKKCKERIKEEQKKNEELVPKLRREIDRLKMERFLESSRLQELRATLDAKAKELAYLRGLPTPYPT